MAAKGRAVKLAEVFTAIKSIKKHEAGSHTRLKMPSTNAVVSQSNVGSAGPGIDAGIDYLSDTLQVTVLF